MRLLPRCTRRRLLGIGLLAVLAALGLSWWAERTVGACSAVVVDDAQALPAGRVALVLGTSRVLADGHANPWFETRMDAAAELWRSGRVRALLVSGDNHRVGYDEASDMRAALVARGVPAAAVHRDFAGFRTLDSVVRAREVFGQDELVVVSQRFHCERAVYLARAHGIAAVGYAAADPPVSARTVWLRERLARIRCLLDAQVLGTAPRFLGDRIGI